MKTEFVYSFSILPILVCISLLKSSSFKMILLIIYDPLTIRYRDLKNLNNTHELFLSNSTLKSGFKILNSGKIKLILVNRINCKLRQNWKFLLIANNPRPTRRIIRFRIVRRYKYGTLIIYINIIIYRRLYAV